MPRHGLLKPTHTYPIGWTRENASYRGEFNTPILWNSNMYMSLETLRILRELVDIWLPDFKFGNNKCAIRLSRTPWYFETVAENHRLIYGWGEDIVIRHLIMPGHVECCTKTRF
jgi:putative pyruvate formate lyase activating enzyme